MSLNSVADKNFIFPFTSDMQCYQ